MNRRTLAAVALVLLPAAAAAQGADAPVQITVLAEVQITRFGVTDFGPVGTGGQTYTIDPISPTGAQQVATDGGPADAQHQQLIDPTVIVREAKGSRLLPGVAALTGHVADAAEQSLGIEVSVDGRIVQLAHGVLGLAACSVGL